MDEQALPGASPVHQKVRPTAWWIPAYAEPFLMRGAQKPMLWPEAQPLYDQAALDAAVAAERERCAKVCESLIDEREQARASLAAAKAIKDGCQRDMIDRLSHEGTVHLYNRTLQRCVDAIRAA